VADLSSSAGISHLLSALQFIGCPSSVLASIKGLLHDSGALLITLIFFFLPFNLSKIGVVIITLLLPAYKSSLVIVEAKANPIQKPTSAPKMQTTKVGTSMVTSVMNWLQISRPVQPLAPQTPHENRVQFWLEYWMCLATLLLLQSYNVIQLWPNSQMVLCLWLQNSHFSGAAMIFQRTSRLYHDLVSYEKTRKPTPRAALLDTTAREDATAALLDTTAREDAPAALLDTTAREDATAVIDGVVASITDVAPKGSERESGSSLIDQDHQSSKQQQEESDVTEENAPFSSSPSSTEQQSSPGID
jgi:hypothetical protein